MDRTFKAPELTAEEKEAFKDFSTEMKPNATYIETHVFGPIDLRLDVSHFEFMESPPAGDFLNFLLAYGIRIRDRRDSSQWLRKKEHGPGMFGIHWHPVEWMPQL